MRGNVASIARFVLVRLVGLLLSVVAAVYLTVIIVNLGGELDDMRISQIQEQRAIQVAMNPEYRDIPQAERERLIQRLVEQDKRRLGLDQPFMIRSFRYTINAITLDLGRSESMTSDRGSRLVRNILLDRLPPTLILFGTVDLLLFFFAVFGALFLSRRYGSFLDRTTIALAPTSAAPGWFYGIFLIIIFGYALNILPTGRMVSAPPPDTTLAYMGSVIQHMILPVTAVLIGAVFLTIYSWRTFFLVYSSEDYVELARAKGLPSGAIERRYVLRPTLPAIITSFLLMIITTWMGQIILETVFRWPGIGRLFYQAITLHDTPVIVGTIVIQGYLLALSVFLLDFIYAAVDPRVRVGKGGGGTS